MPPPSPSQPEDLAGAIRAVTEKLERLDARLAALESAQGFAPQQDDHAPASEPAPTLKRGPEPEPNAAPAPIKEAASAEAADTPAVPAWSEPTSQSAAPPAEPKPAPSIEELEPAAAYEHTKENFRGPKTLPRFRPENFEWLLGAKGLALAGMLIVVVGVAMFLKYAYDEGWLGAISPAGRCAASAGFGALMLTAGEYLRRRINPLASSGTSATGIAIVYASILAASNLYGLISTPLTFIALAGITVLGVLLGSLSNRVMLAMLLLGGAFLVPFMLDSREPSLVAMPAYLLALLGLGLLLAG
ncbi:MAG: DUF2339 domain-containing protein [Planctomycetota bacterium]